MTPWGVYLLDRWKWRIDVRQFGLRYRNTNRVHGRTISIFACGNVTNVATWGVYDNERNGTVHLIPCHDDGEMYDGHEAKVGCMCRPRMEIDCTGTVWVHREDS